MPSYEGGTCEHGRSLAWGCPECDEVRLNKERPSYLADERLRVHPGTRRIAVELKQAGNVWRILAPANFTYLFEEKLPTTALEWNQSKFNAGQVYANIEAGSESVLSKAKEVVNAYRRLLVINRNPELSEHFTTELDSGIVLDYNYHYGSRTAVGEREYLAKYKQDAAATQLLAQDLFDNLDWLPGVGGTKRPLVSYVPSAPDKAWDLPREMARLIAPVLRSAFPQLDGDPFLEATLRKQKPRAKELSMADRVKLWDDIIRSDGIVLSKNVGGRAVLVVDDLYQSGVSLWSTAKFLKAKGAARVFGLVCVKSLSDTDNA